ncbi:MepB family protein [Candidatus Protochlamydia amoebophila]|uniref:MepB family protein n=1 Tax=Protochlamydia amoebophila (strain UWE25) TaxID=264201 RepID=Q6MDY9_PARUW|nr:MepB family protein [Candidatus Protochlamydia amoebophila]CAF23210.1 unnamed protein product [Candidatus Protochlamydia amoebophila UWE25]
MHPNLLLTEQLVYKPMGWKIENLQLEQESVDYGAANFEINQRRIKFRVGKITPTKTGQFVTFWKRSSKGLILPYAFDDPFDLFVVNVCTANRFGQFVFPKSILYEKAIISKNEGEGKRAIRVYPSWDQANNLQAKKTQAWQLLHFFEINENLKINFAYIQGLFGLG